MEVELPGQAEDDDEEDEVASENSGLLIQSCMRPRSRIDLYATFDLFQLVQKQSKLIDLKVSKY